MRANVEMRALVEQVGRNGRILAPRGPVQRCPSSSIGSVSVCAGLNELLDREMLLERGCEEEGRVTVGVPVLEVSGRGRDNVEEEREEGRVRNGGEEEG